MKQQFTPETEQDFIYLVSCALNGETPDPERCAAMEMDELFRIAQEHSLACACAFALEQVMPLPEDFREKKYKNMRRLSLYKLERAKIYRALEENGIWHLPLKGIVVSQDYPKESMREMSDNDLLCDDTKMDEVRAVMEGLGYQCTDFDRYHHDVYAKPPSFVFEMHRCLVNQKKRPEIYAYYRSLKDKLLPDGDSRYRFRMTDEDCYIYLMYHLYMHYVYSGEGLRSLADIYVFNQKHPAMDQEYLAAEFATLQIAEFADDIRTLAQKVFTAAPLSDKETSMLSYFLFAACHGNMETRLRNKLGSEADGKAKRKYIRERVFLSDDELRLHYPVVHRHKVLYPLLLVYRPVKGLVKNRRHLFQEVETLKNVQKDDSKGEY